MLSWHLLCIRPSRRFNRRNNLQPQHQRRQDNLDHNIPQQHYGEIPCVAVEEVKPVGSVRDECRGEIEGLSVDDERSSDDSDHVSMWGTDEGRPGEVEE